MRRLLLLSLLALPWIASAQIAVPIDCGIVADGSFNAGITDFYNFNAIGGDAILVRVLNTSTDKTFTFKIAVSDPTNRIVTPRPNPTNLTVGATASAEYDLSLTGPYQIRVTNTNPSSIGSYKVTFTFINRPCNSNTLTCGGGVRDLFTAPLQAKTYQFDVQAGDILSARIVRFAPFSTGATAATFDPAILFYSPSGKAIPAGTSPVTAVIAAPVGTGRLDFTAAETGLYNILVYDPNNTTGNYGLVITKLNGTCGSNTGTVSCGAVTQGSLGAAFNIDRLKMTVSTGDIVVLRAVAAAAGSAIVPTIEVYDAASVSVPLTTGVIAGNRPVPTFTFTAKSSGDFLILLRDLNTGQNTGPYAITLLRLNRPCASQTLSCSAIVDGRVAGLLGVTLYTLDANAGDNYLFRVLRGDQNATFRPRADIYGPSGNLLQSFTTTDLGRLAVSMPVTGTYSVVLSDSFDSSQTGNYTISSLRLNQPCGGGTVSCGVPSTAQIPRSLAASVFSYNAAAGESFSIRLLDNGSGVQPALDIFDPNGNAAGQPIPSGTVTGIDVVQPVGGAYTLVASDANKHPAPGSFTLDLVRTVNACAASPAAGQTVSGVVSGAGPFVAYTIPASAGDALSIRSASFTPSFAAQMELYDPTGARLDSQTYSLTRNAPASGNYTVIVGPASPHTGGGYSFAWQALNNPIAPAALACGGLTNASLASSNEFRYYTIPAAAGDVLRLLLTKTSDNFSPQLELFDPTGSRIALGADILQTAATDGNYLAAITPASSNGETGSFAVAFQRPNNPCNPGALTCGQSTLRRATLPGQLDTLTFSGTAGDKADIRFSTRAGSYSPLVELYDSKGARLATNNTGVLQPTLSAAGPFSLLIRDRASVNTGTYRVSLQDLSNACPVNDSEPPTISLIQPTGGDVIAGGTSFRIQWQSDDNVGVTAHDIALSTDGGQTFATKIASAVSGTTQSFNWVVPPDIAPSRTAILRITATDAAGNTQAALSGPLTIIGAGFTPNSTPTFTYDALNRITQATLPDGHVVTYTYDAAGNLISVNVK